MNAQVIGTPAGEFAGCWWCRGPVADMALQGWVWLSQAEEGMLHNRYMRALQASEMDADRWIWSYAFSDQIFDRSKQVSVCWVVPNTPRTGWQHSWFPQRQQLFVHEGAVEELAIELEGGFRKQLEWALRAHRHFRTANPRLEPGQFGDNLRIMPLWQSLAHVSGAHQTACAVWGTTATAPPDREARTNIWHHWWKIHQLGQGALL